MNTNEIIARLQSILDFYKNDGHFITENEAEAEIEALKHAIRTVELLPKYAEALTIAYTLASRHYQSGYLLEMEKLLDEVVVSKMEIGDEVEVQK